MGREILMIALLCSALLGAASGADRQLLWGDTHLHTSYSFDAFLNNNLSADPDTAYRWAKGQPVIHPYNRVRVQIETPLDFLVVSDHAEFLGVLRDIYFNGIHQEDAGPIDRLRNWYVARTIRNAIDEESGRALFTDALPKAGDPRELARNWNEVTNAFPIPDDAVPNAWREITETAERHYEPGAFTTFIGWEWSTIPGGANLHRVIFTTASAGQARDFLPFGSDQSPYPEDLWNWLASTSASTGAEFIAIPHNSNISKGLMFDDRTLRGEAFTAEYAEARSRWERVVEITQIKGDSETHPALSPDDPFADFETYPFYIQQRPEPYQPQPGDYIRPALRSGLKLGAELGINPFEFGVIGSTDAHTGLSSAEEPNFWGKMATDSIPEKKAGFSIAGGPTGWSMSAAGLAAVWAEENTRESIMAAFKRREVYATSGPRIRVRLFGGWNFTADDLDAPDPQAVGYGKGVPMGGTLSAPGDGQPGFLIWALQDPKSAGLDRIQIIKGWLDQRGETHERIYDLAWSGDREPAADGQLPAIASGVDLTTGRLTVDSGAPALRAFWQDPDFDPGQRAFYYARVLQVPTARHGLLDALALGEEAPREGPAVIQERAYTSAVWYSPAR